VIGPNNIANVVSVMLVAVFCSGVGLTIVGSISLARLAKLSISMDSVSDGSKESLEHNQEEKEE
jgi:hypothetical protein